MKSNTILNIIIFCYLLLITGCNSSNEKSKEHNNSNKEIIHFDVSNWETDKVIPKNIIKKIDFIPLETNDQCLLSGIGKMIVHNDKWYIMDNGFAKNIYVFSKKGKFLCGIGTYGRGPGEFLKLTNFTINKTENKLLILDSNQDKLLIYDCINGNFLSEIKLSFWATNITWIGGDTLAFYSKTTHRRTREGYSITYLILKDKSTQKFLPKNEYDTNRSNINSIFESENTYYAPFLNDIVYKIDDNGVWPAITFDFGNSKIPEDKLRSIRINGSSKELSNLIDKRIYIYGINNVRDNKHFLTVSLRIRNQGVLIIYCKDTGNYFYGKKIENPLFGLSIYSMCKAIDNADFLNSLNAYKFKIMKKRIEANEDIQLKKNYLKIYNQIKYDSNPIIVSIKYNKF
jgi:hypothetical protein